MLAQPPIWLILVAFILAIGPLVFFHELGHYLVARLCGIGAETFSIGFGREIVGWTDKRGTRWKVGWLPLGGYVRFVGDMNPASQAGDATELSSADRARAFHLKPVWQRFLVVLAGPAANFLLAIAIFAAFFTFVGYPSSKPVIGEISPGSAAEVVGLKVGDRILSIAGQGIQTHEDIVRIVTLRPGHAVSLVYVRGNQARSVKARLGDVVERNSFGQSFRVGRLGVKSQTYSFDRISPIQALPKAIRHTVVITRSMLDGLGQIIAGERTAKDLGGPIKMAQIAGQTASLGPFEFVQLIAFFSINLGFINLLPVPMLDGGHLLFYAIEAVRRRPVSVRAQEWAFRGGLALLLALLLFTTANDLLSVGLVDRLGRLIG